MKKLRCQKCNKVMENKGLVKIKNIKKWGLISKRTYFVNMWVCSECNYVEFSYFKGAFF